MKRKHKLYRDGDNYLLATGECPKQFKDVLFVVWTGDIDNIKEDVRTKEQLQLLEEVHEIPGNWIAAFSRASGIDLGYEKPEPETSTQTNPSRRDTPLDEFVGHCAAGTDPVTAAVVSGLMDEEPVYVSTSQLPIEQQVVFTICLILGVVVYAAFVYWI